MKFDLRFVGDEYYPGAWANRILSSREPIPGLQIKKRHLPLLLLSFFF
jgi:hypothetical protein